MDNLSKSPIDKIGKLKKLNVYESLWVDFDGLIRLIMDENLNILNYRSNLKVLVHKIITEVADFEFYFIQMLSCLETPHKFISHSLNTAIFTYIFSTLLDLDVHLIPKMIQAALLHDIGKLEFNEKIKDLYLFRDEDIKQVVENHSVWGERIMLYHLKTDPEIARFVLNHHEQNDGSGFPRGLKSTDLTIADQIIFTANLVDNVIQKTNHPGIETVAKNIEVLLKTYENKFLPSVRDMLLKLFSLKNEGRRYRRYKLEGKGRIVNDSFNIAVPCEITNISTSGVEIVSLTVLNNFLPYKINAKITSNLSIKDKVCKVMWNKVSGSKFLYGLKFETLTNVSVTQFFDLT